MEQKSYPISKPVGRTITNLWQRTLAFALDYVVLAAYLLVLVAVGFSLRWLFPAAFDSLFANPVLGQLVGFLILTLPITLYFALSEASARQATWGKRKMELQVTRKNGEPMSKARSLVRTALKFIPWELSHTLIWQLVRFQPGAESPLATVGFTVVYGLVGLNLVSLLLTPSHQTLYDLIADTVVTRRNGS